MTIRDGYVWYFICDENYTYYPHWKPFPAFEVTDNRISRYWVYECLEESGYRPMWTFKEWAEHPGYYDDLVDGDRGAIDVFEKYKELMDLEFPDSTIVQKAEIGDENWLICPICIDAWESTHSIDALVRCPKCQTVFNNPRYGP